MNNSPYVNLTGWGGVGGGPEAYFLVIHTHEFPWRPPPHLLQANKLPPGPPQKTKVIQIQYQLMDITCNG